MQIAGEIAGLQLVEVAGRGGMGVVYKAYDPSLDRYIAIKLLRKDHSSDRNLIAQLETEATITASVNDPNVVRVYATGFDRGRFFLAMELVDQGSLDDLIKLQTRVAEVQVLQVGIQIAKGLRAAHQHGLIHRDVKPGNILFADANTAKIVDFGLALFMSEIEGANSEIWGTPYYLAPEKLDGGAEDFRSDIYSLGASLFHAIAGRPPFEAATATLVALKHLKSQAVSLHAFAPWVSNATAHVINKTLAKNPADRYQSYDELIHNMDYALEQLYSQGSAAPVRKRVVLETEEDQKTWTWVVLGMVAVIVVLLGVFFMQRPKGDATAHGTKGTATGEAAEKGFSLNKQLAALASGDAKAAELFNAAAADSTLSPTDRVWAQLFEGVSHLAAGRGLQAQTAFSKTAEATSRMKDEHLGAVLREACQRLARRETVAPDDVQKLRKDNFEAIGYFLYGLSNWQQGQFDDGASLLRQFRATMPQGAASWIGELKPMATSLVEQLVTFQMAADQFKNARDVYGRHDAAVVLRKLGPAFASRTDAVIQPFAREVAEYADSLKSIPTPGLYTIINKNSGKAVDVLGRNRDNRAQLVQWDDLGVPNQVWELSPNAHGTFRFTSLLSGRCIDVPDRTREHGVQLHQYESNDNEAQQWRIEPKGNGWFFLRAACNDQVLAVRDMKKDNGTPVTQWDKPGSEDHFWKLERVGERQGDWIYSDVGSVTAPGSSSVSGESVTITANNQDCWFAADSCRFVSRLVTGDFEFTVQLLEFNNGAEWAKSGVMVRTGLTPGARNVFMGLTPGHGFFLQYRKAERANTDGDPFKADLKAPVWLRISRKGGNIENSYSKDGIKWETVASLSVDDMSEYFYVGIANSSWSSSKDFTAKYDHVTLRQ